VYSKYTAVFFAVLFLWGVPAHSHAGIFSFLGELLDVIEKKTESTSFSNVQTMALLKAALNADPNPSKGGGDITIVGGSALLPEVGPLGTLADVEATPDPEQISVYVVREGDSLSQIAEMFGVSVNTIIWANDIRRGDLIGVGETLVILPVSGIRYTVNKGDTLGSIAKKFKGDVEEIKQFNDIDSSISLAVGNIVVIPGGELAQPKYSSPKYQAPVRGSSGPSYAGYYIRPVSGKRTQGLHGFNGVDIGAYVGEPVVAAASGNVIIAKANGWNGGYGAYIVISHPNGTQTLYAHLNSPIVRSGYSVVKGQVIGYAGSTGRSTGPHVHFEVRGAQNPF
jgi:LysM repeat protein